MKVKFLRAFNGDAILISFIHNNTGRNILVDSGIEKTYYDSSTNCYGDLKHELDEIKRRSEFIDLLILTHIDNDHICGILEWFQRDNSAAQLIKKIWFNSGKKIASYFNETENDKLNVSFNSISNPQTGIRESIELDNYLKLNGIANNRLILRGQIFDECSLKITILSPDESQLKKLLKEYQKTSDDYAYTSAKSKDWAKSIASLIAEENTEPYKFIQDTNVKNGSSISFIMNYQDKNLLFLGDSHPTGVVLQLNKLGFTGTNPLKAELLKLSHHGSKGNTNKELIQIIKTDNYIISTDSSRHNHPNKRTLARIIAINPNAIFHFNYEYVRNSLFTEEDHDKFKIKATTTREFNL